MIATLWTLVLFVLDFDAKWGLQKCHLVKAHLLLGQEGESSAVRGN